MIKHYFKLPGIGVVARTIWMLLITSIMVFTSNNMGYAMTKDQRILMRSKQIVTFDIADDCNTSSLSSTSSIAVTASADERLRYIYTWFRGKGLTSIQAAAVVGNIAVESKGNWLISQESQKNVTDPTTIPTADQVKASLDPEWAKRNNVDYVGVGKAWGLIQWDHGARAVYYQKKAGISGDISNINTQLELILWHMKNESPTSAHNMFEKFNQSTLGTKENNYTDGAVYYYEKMMEGAGSPKARVAAANIALQKYESASNSALYSATSDSTSDTTTTTSATDTSALSAATALSDTGCLPTGVSAGTNASFIATVAKYTWPFEWRSGKAPGVVQVPGMDIPKRPSDPTDKTQAYKEAIDKAKKTYFNKYGELSSSGSSSFQFRLYVGSDGVDCGGFVTRLVQDSGLDPHYNMVDSKGRVYNGPTATQADYLANSGVWQKIESGKPSSYYQPGDVAIQDGHTLIFVGEISTFWPVRGGTDKGGGGTVINPSKVTSTSGLRKVLLASASQDLRSPMADKDEVVGSSAYTWYRHVSTSTTSTNSGVSL